MNKAGTAIQASLKGQDAEGKTASTEQISNGTMLPLAEIFIRRWTTQWRFGFSVPPWGKMVQCPINQNRHTQARGARSVIPVLGEVYAQARPSRQERDLCHQWNIKGQPSDQKICKPALHRKSLSGEDWNNISNLLITILIWARNCCRG